MFLFIGCTKNHPNPSWLEVDNWTLVSNTNSQNNPGVLTHNFTDAWVYLDDDLVGVFEVPFKIPLMTDGSHKITIYPTIKNNGISATKKIYPFMEKFEQFVNLQIDQTVSLSPHTYYKDNIKFWVEDFEDVSFSIIDGTSTLATMTRSNDPSVISSTVNEGFFGAIQLDETNFSYTGSTTANAGSLVMALPQGKECYLEIDYYNTNSLITSVLNITNDGTIRDNPMVQLNAQSASTIQWKKIYIDLREVVSGSTNVNRFEFGFNALFDNQTSGEIYIDNIKAVYF